MGDARSLVESVEESLAPLDVARNTAWWDLGVEATDETERRRADTELVYSSYLADADLFARIEGALSDGADPETRRRLSLLRAEMLPNQVPDALRERIVELETAVESRYARHRGVVHGEEVDDNAIKRILRESDDVDERREAWEASKTVGAAVAIANHFQHQGDGPRFTGQTQGGEDSDRGIVLGGEGCRQEVRLLGLQQ